MLVHQPYIFALPPQHIEAVEVSCTLTHKIANLEAVIVDAGRSKGIAGEKQRAAAVALHQQAVMIECLSWKFEKGELEFMPAYPRAIWLWLPGRDGRSGQARHPVMRRVLQDVGQARREIDRASEVVRQHLCVIGVVIMVMSDPNAVHGLQPAVRRQLIQLGAQPEGSGPARVAAAANNVYDGEIRCVLKRAAVATVGGR